MKIEQLALLFLLVIGLLACSKEEIIPDDDDPILTYGDVSIRVAMCIDYPICNDVVPVPGVEVRAYLSEKQQEEGLDFARQAYTDETGVVRFSSLESYTVYLSCFYEGNEFTDIVQLPRNTLTFQYFDFPG